MVSGIIVAINQEALISSLITYLIYSVISFEICYISYKEKSFRWFLLSIIAGVIICCIHMATNGYHYDYQRIVLSGNSNPNILGIILSIGLFCAAYTFNKNLKEIILGSCIIIPVLYYVIQTGSRKSFIAAGIITAFWLFNIVKKGLKEKKKGNTFVICILFIFLTLLGIQYYKNEFTSSSVFSRMQTFADEDSNAFRIYYYQKAFDFFSDSPLIGKGFSQFGYALQNRPGHSHSTFAEAIACFGLLGCILYFTPIIMAFRQSVIKARNSHWGYRPSMILVLTCVELFLGVGTVYFYEMFHFFLWTIIYLALSENVLNKEETETSQLETIKVFRGYKYVKN